jgi:hypothetical protein
VQEHRNKQQVKRLVFKKRFHASLLRGGLARSRLFPRLMVRVFSRVIVGWQNGIDKGKGMEQAVGVCEDL